MIYVASVAQKGGVGKTSLAGFIGTLYQGVGWRVLLADMDVSQASLVEWSPSYCVVSCGGTTLEVVRKYIARQRAPIYVGDIAQSNQGKRHTGKK